MSKGVARALLSGVGIEAVGFDLGETLVEYEGVSLDWQHEYPGALAAVASLWGGSLTAAQVEAGSAVLRRFNTRLAPRRHEVDSATVFGELLDSLGVPAEDARLLLDTAADAFFSVFGRRARAFPDVGGILAALAAAGTSVGVLTDVPYGMPRRLVLRDLSAAGLEALAASLLTSGETGVRKPDPAGFEALAGRLGCSPDVMLFVGDEQKDIAGARAAGMTAALLWRGDSPVPSWGHDLTLTSLTELVPLVVGSARAGARQTHRPDASQVRREVQAKLEEARVIVRPETDGDVDAIREVNIAAFQGHPYSQQTEHLIVEALRAADAMEVSLVAESDGEVVGHIAFSAAAISGSSTGWSVLGPVAVVPARQGEGIGRALVEAGLDALRSRGARGCVLVGDPAFYGRFGFEPTPGVTWHGVPPENVLCLLLSDEIPAGEVACHPAFLAGDGGRLGSGASAPARRTP